MKTSVAGPAGKGFALRRPAHAKVFVLTGCGGAEDHIVDSLAQGAEDLGVEGHGVQLVSAALLSRDGFRLQQDTVNDRLCPLFGRPSFPAAFCVFRHHELPLSDGEAFHMGMKLPQRKALPEF